MRERKKIEKGSDLRGSKEMNKEETLTNVIVPIFFSIKFSCSCWCKWEKRLAGGFIFFLFLFNFF